jgi:response regulator RpfG family c-di-GMP phosphodiesterase
MTILLVDDEPVQRLLIGDLLEEQGWKVVSAESGAEGLEKLAVETIDIIISDVYMPIMDGLKFHTLVRSRPESQLIPFLFISAFDDQYTRDAVKDPKIESFLKKGFTGESLKAWVEYLTTPLEQRNKVRHPGERVSLLNRPRMREADRYSRH